MQTRNAFSEAVAHVSEDGSCVHALDEHLAAVQRLAAELARKFGAEDWGVIAGRWHDLGKYSLQFQKYIRGVSGYEAHLVDAAPGRVNHSSAGALLARQRFGNLGLPLAYVIAGHHAGLPDWSAAESGGKALQKRLGEGQDEGLLAQALESIPKELLDVVRPEVGGVILGEGFSGLHLWIRTLFSCLTDADFLDTEAFMEPEKSGQRGKYPGIEVMLAQLNKRMDDMVRAADSTAVNRIRANVLQQCREKASMAPGLYTLTVPTGGGKTLSSLSFALEHARQQNKDRVIYAIPYTSIIEQTANVFRGIFDDAVVEHHSNLDSERETPESRLACENWDAPLVVTTNVQLFESLFSARTSRCRKLHNIVNSVVILDEAQLLPPDFLQPILDAMRLLIEHYGVTFVLCTATQPALETQKESHGRTLLRGLDGATEIVSETDRLYHDLERVCVNLPNNLSKPEDWDELAERIQEHDSVLAIANSRADCRELHRRMPPGTIHLSALMCGEHRSAVIAEIKDRLLRNEPVRVVSTQLIEAGVDVDFPVVYRAMAGLDSIAQAAGRCNREGKLPNKGEVFVFVPPQPAPNGLLRFGEDACRILLEENPQNPLSPEQFRRYFEHYYSKVGKEGLDKHCIGELLTKDAAECKIQFRTAGERFQLIDDEASTGILVPYTNPRDPKRESRPLLARLRSGELHRELLRQLQRYAVSVPKHEFERLQKHSELEEPQPGLWILRNETGYHQELGLLTGDTGSPNPEKLYC